MSLNRDANDQTLPVDEKSQIPLVCPKCSYSGEMTVKVWENSGGLMYGMILLGIILLALAVIALLFNFGATERHSMGWYALKYLSLGLAFGGAVIIHSALTKPSATITHKCPECQSIVNSGAEKNIEQSTELEKTSKLISQMTKLVIGAFVASLLEDHADSSSNVVFNLAWYPTLGLLLYISSIHALRQMSVGIVIPVMLTLLVSMEIAGLFITEAEGHDVFFWISTAFEVAVIAWYYRIYLLVRRFERKETKPH